MTKFWLKIPAVYDLIQIFATGGFLKKVTKSLPDFKNKEVFELGCGTGELAKLIKTKYYEGWDINPDFIALAQTKLSKGKAQFSVHNVVVDAFPKRSFDYIIIMNVLHHLSDNDVKKLFTKIKKWGRAKEFIIVESRPKGNVGKLLERLDAGENFRNFDKLTKMVKKVYRVSSQQIVTAPFKTYEYLVLRIKVKKG